MNPLGQYNRIPGLSDEYRTPIIGKIYLGKKVPNQGKDPAKCACKGQGCFNCTHPTETDYFVVDEATAKALGTDQPRELDVVLPAETQEEVFPQFYARYGSSKGVKCKGNGQTAHERQDDGEWKEHKCPCDWFGKKNGCSLQASLMVMLPKVALGGVYRVTTGSIISVRDINSSIKFIRAMVAKLTGREALAWIPLKLRRVPTEVTHEGKKQKHYTLQLVLNASLPQIEAIRERPLIEMHVEAEEEERPDLRGRVYAGDEVIDTDTGEVLTPGEQQAPGAPTEAAAAPTQPGQASGQAGPEKASSAPGTPVCEATMLALAKASAKHGKTISARLKALGLENLNSLTEEQAQALLKECGGSVPGNGNGGGQQPAQPAAEEGKFEGIDPDDLTRIMEYDSANPETSEAITRLCAAFAIKDRNFYEGTKEQGAKLRAKLTELFPYPPKKEAA